MVWSGEEQGLLGSAAYVKAHKELTPKISAVLVHDGGTNYDNRIFAFGEVRVQSDACGEEARHNHDGEPRACEAELCQEVQRTYSCTGSSFTFWPSLK